MTPSVIFALYGLFVLISGFIGFYAANYESKARSSIIMGSISAAVMFLFSIITRSSININIRSKSYRIGIVAVLILAIVFLWRGVKLIGIAEKQYLFQLLLVLAAGSAITLKILLQYPPEPVVQKKKE